MVGEAGSGRSTRLPRAEPKRVPSTLRKFEGLAFLSRQPGAIVLQFCSSHLSSRIYSNSMKTNDGRHGYPSQNRADNLPGFGPFAARIPFHFFHGAYRE